MTILCALLWVSPTADAAAPSIAEAFAAGQTAPLWWADGPAVAPAPVAGAVPAPVPGATPAPAANPTDPKKRNFLMEVSFRFRNMSVPKGLMDIWFFNEKDPGWAWTDPRPNLNGLAFGLEFVVKGDSANGIFYIDYVDSGMKEGYWDDVEEPADHLDGDYLKPTKNLGLLAFGADYAYEVHMVRTNQTKGYFGLSFLVGGGLGAAVMLGQVDRWGPDDNGNPSYKRYLEGQEPDGDKRIPSVYPMVDINAGLRFNFGDRAVLRVEGGLHTMIYYGATLGIMF